MSDTTSIDSEDQARLNRGIEVREMIINQLTQNGIPEAKEDRSFLLAALDGTDRVVLSRSKIKSDDKQNNDNQESARTIAQMLAKLSVFKKLDTGVNYITPELPAEHSAIEILPGETTQGISRLNYEEFTKLP